MKKMSVWAVTAAVACLSLVGCKGKGDNNSAEANNQANATEQTESEATEGDEMTAEGELDDYMVCPLMLQIEGKTDDEGNPVCEEVKWMCGSSVGTSTMADWVMYNQDPRFGFNKGGWHFVGKDIVNKDETYKIVDEDAWMALSSYCTIRTEKYVKPEKVEAYEHVSYSRLYEVEGTEMEQPLLKTFGNRHAYTDENKEYVESHELMDKVMTSFYLQEWVSVQLPGELLDKDLTLAVMPYQARYENVKFDADKLSECVWTGKLENDEESGNAVAAFYVNEEMPVGYYDLLIIANEKAQYRLTVVMTKENKKD